MDILSYVAELIQTHKEVGIPQVGTFFKKKSPGRYDAKLHSFLPPRYQLGFKQEVTEETLLSEFISKQHNLSSESAQYHIDKFAEELNQQLKQGNEVNLKTLGKLVFEGDILHYEANEELNLGYEFYGLPAIQEEKNIEPLPVETEADENVDAEKLESIIIENEVEEENPGNLPEEPIYKPEIQAVEEVPVTPFYQEAQVNYQIEEQEQPRRSSVPVYVKIIIAVLVLFVIALGLFLLRPELKSNFADEDVAVVPAKPVIIQERGAPVTDSLEQDLLSADTVTNVTTDKLSTDTVIKVPAKAAENNTAPTGPVTFEVIGSSVYGEKEAAAFIASMKKKWGINAKIVSQRPGKKIKISIATYKDEKTARAERNRLEEKINIPGLYIYVNTHKPE